MFFVYPSISFGLAFFATLDKDLVMIFKPFLQISLVTFDKAETGREGGYRMGKNSSRRT